MECGWVAYLDMVPGVTGLDFVFPTMTLDVATHPLTSVTVTLYVPANKPVGLATLDVKELGPDQE